MRITFCAVIPEPLSNLNFNSNSVWNSSFSIETNSKIILNASSGKGKTTFTNILLGIRNDYNGLIEFEGKDIRMFSSTDWSEIREHKIACVFQDLQLFSDLSALENILIKNDLTNAFSYDNILELFDLVGLKDKKDQLVATLSMGQKQRIAILRALCQPFNWLILDEPFSHLDKENTRICMNLIENRCAELGAGYIITSLDPNDEIPYNVELKL